MITSLLLALAQTTTQPGLFGFVPSPSGRFRAEIRLVQDERRPDATPRWEVAVSEQRETREVRQLWTMPYAHRDHPVVHLLSDDGTAFVQVDPRHDAELPLVEVWRKSRRLAALDADALHIDAEDASAVGADGTWIEVGPRTCRLRPFDFANGSTFALDLLGRDGRLRTVDLESGWLEVSSGGSTEVQVEPAVPDELLAKVEPVYIEKWSTAGDAVAREPFEVRVEGAFPTPGWRIAGFAVRVAEKDDARGTKIELIPLAVREGTGGVAQVITTFDARAKVLIPFAGSYRFQVLGREGTEQVEERALRVLPAGLFVALRTSGGIAGKEHSVAVHRDGRYVADGAVALAPLDDFAAIAHQLERLPAESIERRGKGADLFEYEITWIAGGAVLRAVFDDTTLAPPYRELVDLVRGLTQERAAPKGPPRWTVDSGASTFKVITRSSGLLKAFGHDHEFLVRDFSGEVRLDPASIEAAALELTVRADSLRLVDDEDRAAIEGTMRTDVLETAKYPDIAFRTTKVSAKALREGRFETVLEGDLTLHGVTRAQRIPALVELDGDRLRASGRFSLKLPDWKIQRPKAAGGTVNVAEKIELEFDVVARRAP